MKDTPIIPLYHVYDYYMCHSSPSRTSDSSRDESIMDKYGQVGSIVRMQIHGHRRVQICENHDVCKE